MYIWPFWSTVKLCFYELRYSYCNFSYSILTYWWLPVLFPARAVSPATRSAGAAHITSPATRSIDGPWLMLPSLPLVVSAARSACCPLFAPHLTGAAGRTILATHSTGHLSRRFHSPPFVAPAAAMATNSNAHPLILPFQQPAALVVCGSRCFSCRSLRGHHRFALSLPLLTVPSPPPPPFPCCTCCFCYRLPLSAFRPHVGRDYWFCWFLPLPLSMWHGFSQSCLTL